MAAFEYFPHRFLKNCKAWPELQARDFHAKAGLDLPRLGSAVMELMSKALIQEMKTASVAPDVSAAGAILGRQAPLVISAAHWAKTSSSVFTVEPVLLEELRRSDIGEVSLSDLNLPYEAFYLHLGNTGLMLNQADTWVEGVLVRAIDERAIRVTLCGAGGAPAGDPYRQYYELVIRSNLFDLPLNRAIEMAIEEDEQDLHSAKLLREAQPDSEHFTEAVESALSLHKANRGTLHAALSMAANVLCYINGYPEDIEEGWSSSTPERLLQKTKAGTSKERIRAKSKLASMGYIPISKVGNRFAQEAKRADSGDVSRSPHWRRGHWRRQAHGPHMQLRKIIWVRPTRVLGGSEQGRTYKVD